MNFYLSIIYSLRTAVSSFVRRRQRHEMDLFEKFGLTSNDLCMLCDTFDDRFAQKLRTVLIALDELNVSREEIEASVNVNVENGMEFSVSRRNLDKILDKWESVSVCGFDCKSNVYAKHMYMVEIGVYNSSTWWERCYFVTSIEAAIALKLLSPRCEVQSVP